MKLAQTVIATISVFLFGCRQNNGSNKYVPTLADQLSKIQVEDQKFRYQADSAWRAHNQKMADSLFALQNQLDEKNLRFVQNLLDSAGFPPIDKTGADGALAIWLTIQHGDTKTQERFLPLFRKAATEGNISKEHLALLEDRVLVGSGKRQLYGSQLARNHKTDQDYLHPLQNVDSVDVWRGRMGMCPLRAYLMNYGINWDPEQYKQILPEIEKYWKEDREMGN